MDNTKKGTIFADLSILETTALEQFNSALELDYVVRGALMPDAHTGYALPIGAVVATVDKIVPSWVGYDIGCGMCALKTGFKISDVRNNSEKIFEEIYKKIPVGFHLNSKEPNVQLPDECLLSSAGKDIFKAKKRFLSIGTLGGGNHFIEIGYDESNNIWIIVHSGSRGVGHGIASFYMRAAHPKGKLADGHFPLDIDSPLGQSYINDLDFGLKFALANRKTIIERTYSVLSMFCEKIADDGIFINRNHNHAEKKNELWVHRKGATHAEKGMMGVIPGNMRDGSFIVKGKGCEKSLCSSSHGAGRVMGRKKAKELLNLDVFKRQLKGITSKVELDTLDEAPDAYKNIFDVMDSQRDLVEIENYIRPLINIKG